MAILSALRFARRMVEGTTGERPHRIVVRRGKPVERWPIASHDSDPAWVTVRLYTRSGVAMAYYHVPTESLLWSLPTA